MELVIMDYDFLKNDIEGWVFDEELVWLYEQAKTMESVVEVGVWKGKSTLALASGCSKIYAVDHFKGNSDQRQKDQPHFEATQKDISVEFLNNLKDYPNLVLYKMDSIEASKLFRPKSIDMVNIDAGHSYYDVKSDLESWLPIAKKLICGHDYYYEGGVMQAVHEMFATKYFIKTYMSIWYVEL